MIVTQLNCLHVWVFLSVPFKPVTPVKPPVVAEWGSGVAPRLDPDTISKHVKQMVDVSVKKQTNKKNI